MRGKIKTSLNIILKILFSVRRTLVMLTAVSLSMILSRRSCETFLIIFQRIRSFSRPASSRCPSLSSPPSVSYSTSTRLNINN